MSRVSRAGVLAAFRDGVTVICELAAQFTDASWLAATPCTEWRAGMPQLWPVLSGWDGDDPWHFLLTASGRDPDWLQVLE